MKNANDMSSCSIMIYVTYWRAGGLSEPETQAAQPSGQELTETATVGLDHGKG